MTKTTSPKNGLVNSRKAMAQKVWLSKIVAQVESTGSAIIPPLRENGMRHIDFVRIMERHGYDCRWLAGPTLRFMIAKPQTA